MPLANFVENLMRRTGAAVCHIVQALPDGLVQVGAGYYVEQALVRFRILDHRFSLAFDGEDNRAFVLFELFHELAWIAAKRRYGLDVFGDIEHEVPYPIHSTFNGAIKIFVADSAADFPSNSPVPRR
jgi:hypothetical protein